MLVPLRRVINALPRSPGQNVELVLVFELAWSIAEWGNPETFQISEEHDHPPQWMSAEDLKRWAAAPEAKLNAALRLHLHCLGIIR
jgi:hypothetical protein